MSSFFGVVHLVEEMAACSSRTISDLLVVVANILFACTEIVFAFISVPITMFLPQTLVHTFLRRQLEPEKHIVCRTQKGV